MRLVAAIRAMYGHSDHNRAEADNWTEDLNVAGGICFHFSAFDKTKL